MTRQALRENQGCMEHMQAGYKEHGLDGTSLAASYTGAAVDVERGAVPMEKASGKKNKLGT